MFDHFTIFLIWTEKGFLNERQFAHYLPAIPPVQPMTIHSSIQESQGQHA